MRGVAEDGNYLYQERNESGEMTRKERLILRSEHVKDLVASHKFLYRNVYIYILSSVGAQAILTALLISQGVRQTKFI